MLKLDRQLATQPQEVQFCTRCVVSNQRPRIKFDQEGVCSACRFMDHQYYGVDWPARERELELLLSKHRRPVDFDVVVPSSGGKDSGYVAHTLRDEYGMHPLCVTWAPFRRTAIGQQNFDAFIDSGFTVLEGHPNGQVHRRLARLCFELLGDAWQPFAWGQMAFAFHIAERFGVKLVFFGENGEAMYSGSTTVDNLRGMPVHLWADQYFKGQTVDEVVGAAATLPPAFDPDRGLEYWFSPDLAFYRPPVRRQLKRKGIEMHWMSYYKLWLPERNWYYSAQHTGFQPNPERSEGTWTKYASLDDKTDGFHFYMGFIKFGIGRATSDAAHEIRDGHITREEGVALVHRYDSEFPARYFREFLEYLEITEERFWEVVDAWRPPHLWERDGDSWHLKHQVS